jgi:hypothetical protein
MEDIIQLQMESNMQVTLSEKKCSSFTSLLFLPTGSDQRVKGVWVEVTEVVINHSCMHTLLCLSKFSI